MKLLILLSSTKRGGVEEYALKIASEATRRKWDTHVAFPKTDGTKSLIQDLQTKQVTYHPLDIAETPIHQPETVTELIQFILPRIGIMLEKWVHFGRVFLFLNKLKPQVVILSLPWADQCFSSILACAVLKIPTLIVFHCIPFKFTFSSLKLKAYQWAHSRNQEWLGVSQSNCRFIAESFAIERQKVLYVNNGTKIETNLNAKGSPEISQLRAKIRIELGIAPNSKILLTVGRLSIQKGHDYLIPTIPHLIKEFTDIYFVWAGDGEQKEFLLQKIQLYGIRDRVLLLGHRFDVPQLLQAADLLVFPTYYEGQPFAILEAMAFNLPIIAADVSGISELIQHQIHGLLTRTGDSCDLLEAIRWALRHPQQMQGIASKAQERVKEFSETKMLTQTFKILQGFN